MLNIIKKKSNYKRYFVYYNRLISTASDADQVNVFDIGSSTAFTTDALDATLSDFALSNGQIERPEKANSELVNDGW